MGARGLEHCRGIEAAGPHPHLPPEGKGAIPGLSKAGFPSVRKCRVPPNTNLTQSGHPMDAEQINQIGAMLADLSVRTVDLRRYL